MQFFKIFNLNTALLVVGFTVAVILAKKDSQSVSTKLDDLIDNSKNVTIKFDKKVVLKEGATITIDSNLKYMIDSLEIK